MLNERGLKINFFSELKENIKNCDVLIIESKFHKKSWINHTDEILNELRNLKKSVSKLFYFDTSDSTSLLHPEVLPIVDGYYKSQVLSDKSLYSKPMYGNRIFTDYVYNNFDIIDKTPSFSLPVIEKKYLDKIHIFWNSSLANYSWSGKYFSELYSKCPLSLFLRYPKKEKKIENIRKNDVSCRVSTAYERDTVSWFRTEAIRNLESWVKTNRLSYKKYWKEMLNSKVVVSPFGWGEINYKDYETFLAGAILVKPDMSHLDTWPVLYIKDETYVSYKWDQSDLKDTVINVLNDYSKQKIISENGRANYFNYLGKEKNEVVFCDRFEKLLS
jgi:hypothetical protein